MGASLRFLIASLLLLLTIITATTNGCKRLDQRYKFRNSDIYVRLVRSEKLQYQIMKGSQTLQTVTFDNFQTASGFIKTDKCSYIVSDNKTSIEIELISSNSDFTHIQVTRNVADDAQPRDCIDLDLSNNHWFGGPETFYQFWPLERQSWSNYSYVTKEDKNFAVAERYWLSSKGIFFYVDAESPLFIDQNVEGYEQHLCLSARRALPYNVRAESFNFTYHIGFAKNAKTAHLKAVQKLLGKPSNITDERMVEHPIWSTWAEYKREINDSVVRDFANQIKENGFNNSQFEIDDDWEICYGALTFRKSKFPNIRNLTDHLKAQGFRVTLWIHPFINKDCTEYYNEAKTKGYLVLNHEGNPDTQWWNSKANEAAYIDFTKAEAREWFSNRLKRLQTEDGIDSFKFDAGEGSFAPADPVLQGSKSLSPLQLTQDYVRTVGKFGPMVEVRAAVATQDLPIFLRMIDKDSVWNWKNGLVTLITTLLQMNMNGYNFVLPDMIGGNGYNGKPTKELFIRWLQANVFMPSLQFSYVPWEFDDTETIEISKKMTELHYMYAPYIIERFKLAVDSGEPVNPPLWWADPTDETAQGIYDQFMLGDNIIAAPVVVEGAMERDIYLPKGKWRDGNTNLVHSGPIWLMNYNANLATLPHFVRVQNKSIY